MDPSARRGEHRDYEDMAVAHVLGGLDQQRGRVFRAHLVDCPDCRARVGELRAIAHDLADVEQAERRVRSAQTIEMKSREAAGADIDAGADAPLVPPRRVRWAGRALVFGGVTVLVLLAAYAFTLREQVTNLQQALEERLGASAALEHGEPLRVAYAAPGVTATTKVHEDNLVLLMEGMDDERAYGLYLVRGQGESMRTLRREAMRPTQGKLFVVVALQGQEQRVIVTEPGTQSAFTADPGGATVLEAALPVGTP